MSELYFNLLGKTHSLRVRVKDAENGEPTVWEGLVDGQHYVYAEFDEDLGESGTNVWQLFENMINAYVGQELEA